MRFFRRIAILLTVLLAACAFIGVTLNTPYAGFNQEAFVQLPKGTSTSEMAELLQKAGAIRYSWTFLAARVLHRRGVLQAGEYRFTQPASVFEIIDRIGRGDVFYYELVVPEGKNMFDIAEAVEHLGLFSADRFLAAARNPTAIRDLDPQAPTLEGYLFPNTYRLARTTTPEQLCLIMTGKFREVWRGLHSDMPVHRTVILASLVEKEGKLPAERPIIASVFARRLSIGMKLDCDPTTIYAAVLAGNFRGAIHKSDLANEDPYNTYTHAGLPPGPIANPGDASLQAALHPADTGYLYFVARADGSGGHNFASSLAAQQANVMQYRRATSHAEPRP